MYYSYVMCLLETILILTCNNVENSLPGYIYYSANGHNYNPQVLVTFQSVPLPSELCMLWLLRQQLSFINPLFTCQVSNREISRPSQQIKTRLTRSLGEANKLIKLTLRANKGRAGKHKKCISYVPRQANLQHKELPWLRLRSSSCCRLACPWIIYPIQKCLVHYFSCYYL